VHIADIWLKDDDNVAASICDGPYVVPGGFVFSYAEFWPVSPKQQATNVPLITPWSRG